MHYKKIRIEGFDIHKLLSLCLKENIILKNIRILSDYEFTASINNMDWGQFVYLTKNQYSVSIIKETAVKRFLSLFASRCTVVGVILFIFIVMLQTFFIAEIRVYGYEKLTETEILETLADAGLYAGCSRFVDLDAVKLEMYRKLDYISWIGITLKGGLAEVTIAEGTLQETTVNEDQHCHIVAQKEGYVQKIIAREGKEVVKKDDFVNVGETLISGIIEIEDKTYSSDEESHSYRYVHADGQVYAKTIYRFVCYQEANTLEKKKTGKAIPGFKVKLGTRVFNTADLFVPYAVSSYRERRVLNIIRPFPIEIAVNDISQLKLYSKKKTEDEIKEWANWQVREAIRNNIPESSQIL
ncbi:MAG TPA: sporulation protein YqfD, partial [Anaerovoracaceae bacterium]|nr:sporulation protein YqfD [Anaerovoracaceae bacterium]